MDIVVNVFGEIGIDTTLADVLNPIANATKNDTIIVNINSYGGEVNTGFAIYDALVANPAKVITRNIGVAMSAAATILMAGDTIEAWENSSTMVHMAWTMDMGNADTLEAKAAELRQIDNRILTIFKKRRNIDTKSEAFQNAYKTEKQMTSKEAKSLGLIDKIVSTNKKPQALKANKAYAYLDKSKLNKNNHMSKISEAAMALIDKGKALFNSASKVMNSTSTVRLASGTELLYTSPADSESETPEVGGVLTLTDGNYPEAGNHTLESGEVVTLDEAGVILSIEMPASASGEPAGETVPKADFDAVVAALNEAQSTIQNLTTEVGKLKAFKASGKPNAAQAAIAKGSTAKETDPSLTYLNRLAEKANKS